MSKQRISTATLIIGSSGTGKTTLLATYAQYLWETYQRILFLYSWDGGAIPTEIQKYMKLGIIRFWRVRTRSTPGLGIETLYKATRGYVPKVINPETGETDPAVELIPPVQSRFAVSCDKGHPLMTVSLAALIQPIVCTQCNTLIARNAMKIETTSTRTTGLELIGGVAFDGLTSMSTVVMDHMDHARGAGDIGGEKAAFGGIVVSGDVKLGGTTRADIGFGQSRAQQFVHNSLSIPYLVEGPVFTGLTAEAAEEGLPIVGLKLPGRAATDEASSWFGNVLEAGIWKDPDGKEHRALFIRPFVDGSGRKHLLKTSGSPGGIPDMIYDPPESEKRYFEGFNLGKYFQMLDRDLEQAVAGQEPLVPAQATYGESTPIGNAQPIQQSAAPVQPAVPGAIAPKPAPANQAGMAAPAPVAPTGLQAPVKKKRGAAPTPAPVSAPALTPIESQTTPSEPPAQASAPASPQAGPPPPPGARPPMRAPGT